MTDFGLRRIVIFPFLRCWLSAWNLVSENRLFETMVGCLLKYSILSGWIGVFGEALDSYGLMKRPF